MLFLYYIVIWRLCDYIILYYIMLCYVMLCYVAYLICIYYNKQYITTHNKQYIYTAMSSSPSLEHTAQLIMQNLHASPNQLLAFLDTMLVSQPLNTCTAIMQLLADTLHSPNTNKNNYNNINNISTNININSNSNDWPSTRALEQSQKLSTSLNYVIQKCFKKADKNPQPWNAYVQYLATAQYQSLEHELREWKIIKILHRLLLLFIQSFEEQLQEVLQTLYFKLSTSHRVMLQSLMLTCDVSSQNKLKFLSQTLADYVELGILELHRARQQLGQGQYLAFHQTRFKQYLQNLHSTLVYLKCMANDDNQQQKLINTICEGHSLHALVEHCLFIEEKALSNNNNNKDEPSQLLSFKGSYQQQECFNNIKALGLKILCAMLSRFSVNSTIQHFDAIKCLALMEKLTEQFFRQLSTVKPNLLHLSENQALVMAMLEMLTVSSKFLFMNSLFWQQHRLIFWKIVYPLLIASSEEVRQFHDDPEMFIAQAQTLVQKEADDPEKVNSVKTYAGYLLEHIVEHVDGALTTIVRDVLAMMESALGITTTSEAETIWKTKCSVQAGFTVLQILTVKTKSRVDILQIIRLLFTEHKDKLLALRKLDLARMLLYLTYNFEYIFRKHDHNHKQDNCNSDEMLVDCSEQYFELIAGSLSEQQQCETTCKVSLFLFEAQCRLSAKLTKIVVDQLIVMIPTTKSIDIFNQLRRTISEILPQLSYHQVRKMLQNCVARLLRQNKQYIHSLRHAEQGTYSNICMLKLLGIIRKIGSICQDMKQQEGAKGKQLMGIIWPVFDLFQFVYQANYDDQLIKVFNTVLSYVTTIDGPAFYQFLPSFAQHHRKNRELGIMFDTYLALLKKGQAYLTNNSEECEQYLTQIVDNLMTLLRHGLCTRAGSASQTVAAISLLQYILMKYPRVKYKHAEIYAKSRDLLQQRYFKREQSNIAAVFNLWIIGSCISEEYDLTLLSDYAVHNLYGYQAKVFALAINLKIKSLCSEYQDNTNTEVLTNKIVYLLQKAIQYMRSREEADKSSHRHTTTHLRQIDDVYKTSSKEKIRDIFVHVKNVLSQKDYQGVMMGMEKIISKEELKGLLNSATKDCRIIYKFK